MADYKIRMNKSLDKVTMEQFTKICTLLGGSFAGSEDSVFTLKDAEDQPQRKDVNNAFAKQGLSHACINVEEVKDV